MEVASARVVSLFECVASPPTSTNPCRRRQQVVGEGGDATRSAFFLTNLEAFAIWYLRADRGGSIILYSWDCLWRRARVYGYLRGKMRLVLWLSEELLSFV